MKALSIANYEARTDFYMMENIFYYLCKTVLTAVLHHV